MGDVAYAAPSSSQITLYVAEFINPTQFMEIVQI